MKHAKAISRVRPARTDLDPIEDLVILLNSIVLLIGNIISIFGIGQKS
jgi:hypothetical protein